MSNYTHFNLSYDDAGVAWMSMDAAGRSVNVLAQEVMAELIAAIDEVAGRAPSGFVFLSAKKRGFIFGADVNEFELFRTAAEVEAHIAEVLEGFAAIEKLVRLLSAPWLGDVPRLIVGAFQRSPRPAG